MWSRLFVMKEFIKLRWSRQLMYMDLSDMLMKTMAALPRKMHICTLFYLLQVFHLPEKQGYVM